MQSFENTGINVNGIICLTPKEAYELLQKDFILLDIRKEYETAYKSFNVPNKILIDYSEIENTLKEIPSDKPLIIADSTGMKCKSVAKKLIDKGINNVAVISGGVLEWQRDNLPLIFKNDEELAKPKFYNSKPKNFIKTSLVRKGTSD